jgi:polyisoprenoid-binding protein YceI
MVIMNFTLPSDIFISKTGFVKFTSDTPLESIEAENNQVGSVLNVSQKTVVFKVPVASFKGFNSDLQHEHLNENYMETDNYPQATFKGKIIEDVDLSKPGTYKVRAKGILSIHGEEKERIIPETITVNAGKITIKSNFEIPLVDHNISIPKIVGQKIAEVISIELSTELKPQA